MSLSVMSLIMAKLLIIVSTLVVCSIAQRSFYAKRPIGYPEIVSTTRSPPTTKQQQLSDNPTGRINDAEDNRRPYIPIEFQSDPLSYYYYLRLPVHQRPFNVINARQIDDWNSKPHTYTLRRNNYARDQIYFPDK
ncbi:uncharacterized protein LOC113231523 [Hyposmocoma kahamanoa]|uniref:uncharacterized protein LOC113231523 n=1 Tax=Hyposmocoma kahamanoa TaxID=1477025 RepID=UPI000E6D9056|nr:uncharacterized protein LOC113231523 [Hyposmocoma kahamanoa]